MAIESVRIQGVAGQDAEKTAVEIAAAGEDTVEIGIFGADGSDFWAVVAVSDLVSALQVLRATASTGAAVQQPNNEQT